MLTLIVPGCCGPLPDKSALSSQLDLEVQKLPLWNELSRADKITGIDGFHQQLASIFDFDNSRNLPYAALDLLGEGRSPENGYWLHADPVSMRADIDHAILFDAQSLQLNEAEADVLIAELNAHFSQDGIILQRGSVDSWYIKLDSHNDVSTTTLHDVVGRNVNRFMPEGGDQQYWRRFMNEAQMLLHSSEINRDRERRGQLPVNSLWLWGEGNLPAQPKSESRFDCVLSNNAFALGLAKHKAITCRELPVDIASISEIMSGGNVCLVLDDLFGAASYADVFLWQKNLVELYKTSLQALIECSIKNNVGISFYPCNGYMYKLRANHRLRFWRRGDIKNHLMLHA